ncbi:hypothetical protein EC973_004711 [Apophysomyces ossiformis]|uniref:Leucine carboxyl methyltransferase 1 n=1 Tax=Apophysomyces ossiformis TaxID=679940 RepID=A0A8H7ELB0_9FUNG|nr:hypothetical protein EC973_004711 [Apophysomyces ossiformis]
MPGQQQKQIVSLGAGYDTRYFMIKSGHLDQGAPLATKLARYFEVDFPELATKKALTIKRYKDLNQLLGPPDNIKIDKGGMELSSHDYCLIGEDLRAWNNVVERLVHYGLDKRQAVLFLVGCRKTKFVECSAPTLFLSECVFIYLAPEDSNTILEWITHNMTNTMFALYEQIRPEDAFGQMMIRNLRSRNIELKGIHAFPALVDQENRFKNLGWDNATAVDINAIHDQCLTKSDIARMTRLEILDELEEWRLLAGHYCIAWAYKSKDTKEAFASIQLGPS